MTTLAPCHRVAVAPMMDCTDRHDRYLLRLISRHVLLYTEMVTTGALLHGDARRWLAFEPVERPLALQLGGSEPRAMARAAALGAAAGFDEINMNVGCPSGRVSAGRFGACLMAEPVRVAACVAAMRAAVSVPVTVKTRIGVDQQDSYDALCAFIDTVAAAGCNTFIVHARKAWLKGLSPKQNRDVPPLRYDVVYRLKADYPALDIVLNGGVTHLDQAAEHMTRVDGVMIGRGAYRNPYLLAEVDRQFFGATAPPPDRAAVLQAYRAYITRELAGGTRLQHMTRHLAGLFQGLPGARAWRRALGDLVRCPTAGPEVVDAAARHVLEPLAQVA